MTLQTHVLIDAAQSMVRDDEMVGSDSSDGGRPWKLLLRQCRGGRSEGVFVISLDNGAMSIDVLPTRGMGIWRVRRNGQALGWQAPAKDPVHPAFVPLMEPTGLGWLDGFNELLCRCGLESNGPPEFDESGKLLRPLHGRLANTPAHYVELIIDESAELLTLRGIVDEARFHFQSLRLTTSISTKLGSNEFTWTDEVENFGGRTATMQMLYHFNIGQPLLVPGSQIAVPLGTVAPKTTTAANEGIESWNRMPPPRSGSDEQVYVCDLAADATGDTRVLVYGLTNDEAVGLRFNKRTLPCFTVWRNTPAVNDGYVLGIEPGTNYPNPRSFEQQHNRVVKLKPGEKWKASVKTTWFADAELIAEELKAISTIQGSRQPEMLSQPRTDWSK